MCWCQQLMNARAKPGQAYQPTTYEHLANIITHGWCILPSLIGLYYLCTRSDSRLEMIAALIYGMAVFILFTVSTVFHALFFFHNEGILKDIFHYADRMSIYIFMGASYTPWLLLRDAESWASNVLYIVWTCCLVGITYQFIFHEKYKHMETLLYAIIGLCPAIGWLGVIDKSGQAELIFGGFVYMTGVVFFKSDGKIPFAHAIWHCFVVVGAYAHYYAVWTYLYATRVN